jgi:hypothetical protein
MTTIKKPPKYAELALDKSAYMPAYEPLFQDDTRPPGEEHAHVQMRVHTHTRTHTQRHTAHTHTCTDAHTDTHA